MLAILIIIGVVVIIAVVIFLLDDMAARQEDKALFLPQGQQGKKSKAVHLHKLIYSSFKCYASTRLYKCATHWRY